jgi:serine/threonine protein kinase
VDLVLSLLSMEPSQRPTAAQILQTPFFKDFNLPEPAHFAKEIQQDQTTSDSNNSIGTFQQTENLR